MSKSEYSDEWRMGVCVPSLRLPSINEEGGATTQSQTNRFKVPYEIFVHSFAFKSQVKIEFILKLDLIRQ